MEAPLPSVTSTTAAEATVSALSALSALGDAPGHGGAHQQIWLPWQCRQACDDAADGQDPRDEGGASDAGVRLRGAST